MLAAVALLALGVAQLFAAGFVFCYARGTFRTGFIYSAFLTLFLYATWDAVPTWLAFEYYAKREAGVTVVKSLGQWKAENPGTTETLSPYGLNGVTDKRGELQNLGNDKFMFPLNARFAYSRAKERLFLSVYAIRYELVDQQNSEVLIRSMSVMAGNPGGFATGGPGWWALWLIHGTPDAVSLGFFKYVDEVSTLGPVYPKASTASTTVN